MPPVRLVAITCVSDGSGCVVSAVTLACVLASNVSFAGYEAIFPYVSTARTVTSLLTSGVFDTNASCATVNVPVAGVVNVIVPTVGTIAPDGFTLCTVSNGVITPESLS